VSGSAELPDQEHIEGCFERSSDLEGDGNATARQSEYDDVVPLRVL
jgi:hypothetical protein